MAVWGGLTNNCEKKRSEKHKLLLNVISKTPSEELWIEVRDIVQEALIKTIPKKTKCKKAKTGCLRKPYK